VLTVFLQHTRVSSGVQLVSMKTLRFVGSQHSEPIRLDRLIP
jgi:hypothetical protein